MDENYRIGEAYTFKPEKKVFINTQPSDAGVVSVGKDVNFTIDAINAVSYQWQISANGTSGWANLDKNANADERERY